MKRQSILIIMIMVLLVVIGVGGIVGGSAMLMQPDGSLLHLEQILDQLPVTSFILPGLFLLGFMGFLPLLLASLWFRYTSSSTADSTRYPNALHRVWMLTRFFALAIVCWLVVQTAYIGLHWPAQWMTGALAGLLLILLHTRRVISRCARYS